MKLHGRKETEESIKLNLDSNIVITEVMQSINSPTV